MNSENERASRANIARMRWRADLHRLNDDEPGAKLQEDTAALEEQYLDAKQARDDAPDDTYVDFQFRLVEQQLQQSRKFWRTVRDGVHGVNNASTIDNFSEPSDDELLDGVA